MSSEKTSRQVAYEAYRAAVADVLLPPWDELTHAEQRAWEAAAQAAVEAASVIVWNRCAACEAMEQGTDNLRSVITEMLGMFTPFALGFTASVSEDHLAEWRAAAGIDT